MTGPQDFWSRRKAAVAGEERSRQRVADEARADAAGQVVDEKSDAEVLSELNLPDPDTLGQGDDFSAFMAKAVPDRLRRRALRRLWISNPILANLDELVDYGEDFTDAATVVEHLQTAYQVGKGMLGHLQAQDEADEADAQPRAAAEADARAEPEAVSAEAGPARPAQARAIATVSFKTQFMTAGSLDGRSAVGISGYRPRPQPPPAPPTPEPVPEPTPAPVLGRRSFRSLPGRWHPSPK